jgi:ribonuclease HI
MSFPQASNNEAEYEALLHGMKMAKACGATRLKIFGDSNLVVQQVMNRCDTINDNMMAYKNLYHYLEWMRSLAHDGLQEHSMDAKSRTSAEIAMKKLTIKQISGHSVCPCHLESSGRK